MDNKETVVTVRLTRKEVGKLDQLTYSRSQVMRIVSQDFPKKPEKEQRGYLVSKANLGDVILMMSDVLAERFNPQDEWPIRKRFAIDIRHRWSVWATVLALHLSWSAVMTRKNQCDLWMTKWD